MTRYEKIRRDHLIEVKNQKTLDKNESLEFDLLNKKYYDELTEYYHFKDLLKEINNNDPGLIKELLAKELENSNHDINRTIKENNIFIWIAIILSLISIMLSGILLALS